MIFGNFQLVFERTFEFIFEMKFRFMIINLENNRNSNKIPLQYS